LERVAPKIALPLDGEPLLGGLRISHIGSGALLLEADGPLSMELQRRILALADAVEDWPEVEEVVPGITNLMLVLSSQRSNSIELLSTRLRHVWSRTAPKQLSGRTLDIPTTYGGPLAGDLEAVARHAGLRPSEVVEIHAAGSYTVLAIASSPGFAYLHGLDPRIACPRKTTPSLRMVKGSVTIGGMLTGVAVSTGPNGWHAIGHSEITFFDLAAEQPTRLLPGDHVRFRPERVLL
jgi:KipI family sensor histidine kinase inhibitor